MANYVLGLDLGPTSVGWSAIAIDPTKKPGDNGYFTGFAQIPNGEGSIPAIGSRIFEAGIDNLGQGAQESPKNKPRREKRSIRRSLRRKKGR
ncbi:MAG: hypothetical protein K9M57_03555, partial [Phycisphaerae bacterium]|nr:hypothetical protein [Phycisphaerae bacterium]